MTLTTEQIASLKAAYAEAAAAEDKGFKTDNRAVEAMAHGRKEGLVTAVEIIQGISLPEAMNLLEPEVDA